jgi:ligand-binding sensor domain-containing protein
VKQPSGTYYKVNTFGRLFFLVLLSVSSALYVSAQHYNFRNISNKDGLPSNFIYRIHQDSKGYLWYLTNKGIARFDGIDYTYFSPKDGYDGVAAYHIAESADGAIWIVTTDFRLFCYREGRFSRVNIPGMIITWVDIDKENNIWLLTRGMGILKLRPDLSATLMKKENFLNVPNFGFTLVCTGKNEFLTGSEKGVFISRQGKPDSLLLPSDLPIPVTPRLLRKKNGHVIITDFKGIHEFDPVTKLVRFLMPLPQNEVLNFNEDLVTHDVWMATLHGIYRFPQGVISTGNVQVYMQERVILSIARVSNDNYYFGTMDDGVFVCNFNAKHIDKQEGLPDISISYVNKRTGQYIFLQ